jgi:hypothetical protein
MLQVDRSCSQTFAGTHLRANPCRRFNIAHTNEPRCRTETRRFATRSKRNGRGKAELPSPRDRHNRNRTISPAEPLKSFLPTLGEPLPANAECDLEMAARDGHPCPRQTDRPIEKDA